MVNASYDILAYMKMYKPIITIKKKKGATLHLTHLKKFDYSLFESKSGITMA